MEIKPRNPQEAEKRWKNWVDLWQKSGKTQRAFCRENGLLETYFSTRKKRLERKTEESFFELPLQPTSAELFGRPDTYEIWINNRHKVVLPIDFNKDQLQLLIKELEGANV